jgi:type IV pilus assembly protein PilB
MIEALMTQLGLDYIDLNAYQIPSEMAQLLPKGIAKKYMVVPVRANRNDIYLAMSDPLNFMAIEEVGAATHRHVIPMISTEAATERAVRNLYSNQGAIRAMEDMRRDLAGDQYAGLTAQSIDRRQIAVDEEELDEAPTIRLVNSIIERACAEHASDIHLEPMEDKMQIRMRIDGVLRPIITVPRELQASVISRLKIMGRMDIAQKNVPQDGQSNVTVRQENIDLRLSTLPTIYGEKIVIRLLHEDPSLVTVEGIGLTGRNKERFFHLLDSNKDGMILMVGPTGSGKTSTMYTMIDHLKSEEVNLISLEDPVEYHMENVCQVQIDEKTDLTFANALRAVLRQDPDIIAVGEIRDGETAEIALRSAMTGHMVLSTMHTTDAMSALDRLVDIGVEPFLIAGATRGIISQRLLRRICPHCRKAYVPSSEEVHMMGLPPTGNYQFYRGEGCPDCFNTGYRGRVGAFEIMTITPSIRHAMNSHDRQALERAVQASDFSPLLENCAELVINGITTVDEVVRMVGKE